MKSIHVRRLQSRVARTAVRFVEQAGRDDLQVADLLKLKLPWYTIRDEADEPAEPATVFIFDEIGGSFGVDAKTFATELEEIDAPEIRVRINSPGGSVFDAIAIYNALNHHPARITVYVDSLAASAASVIAMAGDEIVMMPGSQMMIHDASMVEDGNAADMAKASSFLDRQSDNIADLYRLRAGGEVVEWRELMLAETWMFAQEAVDMGLADRVEERPAPVDPDLPVDTMTRAFDLSQFRYPGRQRAPEPARRRAIVHTGNSRRVRSEVTMRAATRATTIPRVTATEERRVAAEARAAGAAEAGYRTNRSVRVARWNMPAGLARSVPFPARLRARMEKRNGEDRYHLFGQASLFDTPYEMWDEFGPYDEIVDGHAGDESLAAGPDVAFLVNHRGVTMARTTNGTLELAASSGLDVDAWLNPKRQDVSDLVVAVEDEDITEMSFAFLLEEGWWSDDFTTFRIAKFDINRGDVSAVNYGANPYTSIAARAREVLADLDHLPAGAARAAIARLQGRVGAVDLRQAVDRGELVTVGAASASDDLDNQRRGRTIAHIEALLLDA